MTLAQSPDSNALVFVVDDDISVRESLEQLIRFEGLAIETFSSAEAFLARPASFPLVPSCLVLDVSLPDLNGLELQKRMAADRMDIPIIFVTGYGDIPMSVQAMKAGAAEFLTKPFRDEAMLYAIRNALEKSRASLISDAELRTIRDNYESLTRREREVMDFVVSGLPNKLVADKLGISEITVKAHRGQVMRKMKAKSLPALVKFSGRLRVDPTTKN